MLQQSWRQIKSVELRPAVAGVICHMQRKTDRLDPIIRELLGHWYGEYRRPGGGEKRKLDKVEVSELHGLLCNPDNIYWEPQPRVPLAHR